MILQFTDFIKKHALFNRQDKILIAFSGGVDSTVLVDLFHKAEYHFGLAHCNFLLRGNDSDSDEETAKKIAEIYKVPIFIKRFNTVENAKSKGISIEMAARDLRYNFFNEICDSENYNYIATAHHIGDALETMLLNLTKGTGIAGLRGILPKRQNIVRPLLFANKQTILNYAKENKLIWREDLSNEEDIYQRNQIRLNVIPALEKINPHIFESLKTTTAKLRFTEKVYSQYLEELKKTLLTITEDHVLISKNGLLDTHDPVVVLSEIVKGYDFNFHQCEQILGSINHSGKLFYTEKYQLNIDREHLYISKKNREELEILIHPFQNSQAVEDINYSYLCSILRHTEIKIPTSKNIAFLDFEKLKFPLKIRTWMEGDKFMPLGMRHKKKLSDFMIDEKIPVNLKRSTKVLVSNNDIVWVVGHRIDDRYKITDSTQTIFEIIADKK